MTGVRVGKAVFEIGADDTEMRQIYAQLLKNTEQVANQTKSIGSNLNVAAFKQFGEIAFKAVAAVGEKIVELAQRGAEVDGVQSAFDKLTTSVGSTRDAMLDASRSATKGLISDFDLMAAGNKAMLLGLPVTAQSLGTMGEAAVVLGRAMKQDATKSFDDLITALGRGSPMILDNLGLSVKVGEANEAYARSLGKSADALTEAEKKTAFYNAAMEAAKAKVAEVGGINLTLADMVTIATTKFGNFTDQLGVGINRSPVLRAGMLAIGDSISQAFGGNQTGLVSTLVKGLEGFAIFLIDVAKVGVEFGRVIGYAFTGVKVIFNALLADMAIKIKATADMVGFLAQKASTLPGIGGAMKGLAGAMQSVSDKAGSMATGFADMANKALDGAAGVQAGADKMQTVLGNVQAAMLAARDKSSEMATGVKESMTRTADAAAEASGRTAEHTKAIGDKFRDLTGEILLNTKVGIDRRLAELDISRQKEIDGLKTLKDLSAAEYEKLKLLIDEKYRGLADAAALGTDEMKQRHQQLYQDIALLQSTGLQNQLLQLDFARQKEIDGLENLKTNYATKYAELTAAVQEKYALMRQGAIDTEITTVAAAARQSSASRAEMEQTAAKAQALYQQLKDSGTATYAQIQAAHKASKDAEAAVDAASMKVKLQQFQDLAANVSSVLRDVFGKSKAAALAAALIDTAAAVVKTMAAYPFPFNLAPAAAQAAAGFKQVQMIRSQQFAAGTPGLDYMNFGSVSPALLHNDEAVIPRGSGHLLAAEIAAAMPGSGDNATLEAIRAGIEGLPRAIKRAIRDAALAPA